MDHPKPNQLPAGLAWLAPPEGRRNKAIASVLRYLLHDEAGQDLIEYALVAALVGLGAVAALKGLSNSIGNTFNKVGSSLTSSV